MAVVVVVVVIVVMIVVMVVVRADDLMVRPPAARRDMRMMDPSVRNPGERHHGSEGDETGEYGLHGVLQ